MAASDLLLQGHTAAVTTWPSFANSLGGTADCLGLGRRHRADLDDAQTDRSPKTDAKPPVRPDRPQRSGAGGRTSRLTGRRSSPAATTGPFGSGTRRDGKPQGAALATGHAGPILAVAISPDGKTILTGSADKTARLIARSDGKVIRTLGRPQWTGAERGVFAAGRSDRNGRRARAG